MAFPVIPTSAAGELLAIYQANTTATRTFPDLTDLTGKASGDLLIAIVVAYQTGTGTDAAFSGWTGGFTEFHDSATTTTMAIGAAYKWSTGSETGTFAVTQAGAVTGHAAMIVMAISGAHATDPPEAGGRNSGTTTAADATAVTPSWGAADTLWVAVGANGEVSTSGPWLGITAAPANYSGFFETGLGAQDVAGAVEGAVAFRQLNTDSEDAGAFTLDTGAARSGAVTIAVRPPAATFEETGTGAAEGAGAGVQEVHVPIILKAGLGAAASASAGVQAVQLHAEIEKAGAGVAAAAAAGVQAVQPAAPAESVVSVDLVGITVTYAPTAPTIYKIKAGAGAAAGAASGVQAVVLHTEHVKVGLGAAGLAATGTETVTPPTTYTKAGTAAAAGVGAGPKTVTAPGAIVKAGTAAAAGAPGGAKLVQPAGAIVKVGLGAAGLAAAGPETVTHPVTVTKAGTGAAAGAAAGARTLDHGRAGTAAAGAAALGPKTVQAANVITKAGLGATAGAGLGPKTVTHPATVTKAGAGVAAGAPGGAKLVQQAGAIVKVGLGAVGTAGAGAKAMAYAKAGTAVAAGAPAGTKVRERAGKAGVAAAAGASSGPKVRERAGKAGLAAAAVAALGGKVRTFQRTGCSAVEPVSSGPANRDSYRAGYGVLVAAAGGSRAALPSSLTQGVAIPGTATVETALGGEPAAVGVAVAGDGSTADYFVMSGR